MVGGVGGCQTAEDSERAPVEAAVGEDREPLLRGEWGGGLHYGGHGIERETCILAYGDCC